MQKNVVITGANGALCKVLVFKLRKEGFKVKLYTHTKSLADNKTVFFWDIDRGYIDDKPLINCNHIIHLSGYSIMRPWTDNNKKLMYSSRVIAAKILLDSCKNKNIKLETFISASAIGYYGLNSVGLKSEDSLPDSDWISRMCVDWENYTIKFKDLGARVAQMRISLLLSNNSGFLKPILFFMRCGLAFIFGNGKNVIEWIHIEDVAKFVVFALKNKKVSGPYNLATEHKINQKKFIEIIN